MATLLALTTLASDANAALAPFANMSTVCQTFGVEDTLLVLNVQNSFMETRPVRPSQSPSYQLNANWTDAGMIPGGPLAVPDSDSIIDVVNSWIEFAAAGSILATLEPSRAAFTQHWP